MFLFLYKGPPCFCFCQPRCASHTAVPTVRSSRSGAATRANYLRTSGLSTRPSSTWPWPPVRPLSWILWGSWTSTIITKWSQMRLKGLHLAGPSNLRPTLDVILADSVLLTAPLPPHSGHGIAVHLAPSATAPVKCRWVGGGARIIAAT